MCLLEPEMGFEPTTYWLQVSCATVTLLRNIKARFSDKRILSLHHKISCCVSLYFLCIYYTKKFLENQLYQSKKDRKNPYWNLNKTYFICADYNESPYTTDLLFIYHRFGSSINMDFPLIFTFCFSSPDRRFGAHALFSSYKISSIQLNKVDESSINNISTQNHLLISQ